MASVHNYIGSSSFLLLWSLGLLLPGVALAQDPVVTNPELYKVRLDNEYVRVLELTLEPGQEDAMHSHPDSWIYFVEGGKVKIYAPDGKTRRAKLVKGKSVWQQATTHRIKNIGKTTIKAVSFEIKKATGGGLEVKYDPSVVAPETNKVIFENEALRVTETITDPGKGGVLHSHTYMSVYCVSPAKLEITGVDGASRQVDLPAGTTIWSDPVTHTVENLGDNITHLLHVEIK